MHGMFYEAGTSVGGKRCICSRDFWRGRYRKLLAYMHAWHHCNPTVKLGMHSAACKVFLARWVPVAARMGEHACALLHARSTYQVGHMHAMRARMHFGEYLVVLGQLGKWCIFSRMPGC